jgi:hypothetical protein
MRGRYLLATDRKPGTRLPLTDMSYRACHTRSYRGTMTSYLTGCLCVLMPQPDRTHKNLWRMPLHSKVLDSLGDKEIICNA